ncbi:PilN domain-containing protein [Edwardsiella tarda]|uniref:PilN domain-containing protein n=1 Tax=Edwardsiella tarda TaxID=636 RepID=UPI003A868C1D
MDDINLLPWRECLRRHRQRTIVAMLSVWLLCQVGLGWGYGQLRGGLRAPLLAHLAQQARQAAWLEERVRQHTLALAALPKWSASATQSVSPLALLVPQLRKVAAVIPANVWLTGLNYDAPYWLLMGKGVGREAVAAFVRQMAQWQWLALSHSDEGDWRFTLRLCAAEECHE